MKNAPVSWHVGRGAEASRRRPGREYSPGLSTQTAWGETWGSMATYTPSGFFDFGLASFLARPSLRMTGVERICIPLESQTLIRVNAPLKSAFVIASPL